MGSELQQIETSPETFIAGDERNFRVGDWVEVRSKEEILTTLDENGRLEGMPFMPEMFAACGKRFRVYKRAHKTCDTVYEYKGRRMKNAVHLEGSRCDGHAHGGCEAACLIFWKTAWLRPFGRQSDPLPTAKSSTESPPSRTEADVLRGSRKPGEQKPGEAIAYVCQATQVPAASLPLPWWEWRQYVDDYRSGNVSLGRIIKSFLYVGYRHGLVNLGIGIGPALQWLYDIFQALRGGTPYPSRGGKISAGGQTPTARLDLQPGELVRVKSYREIRATIDKLDANRGMKWDPEMVPYCGHTYRVLKRVNRILNERTGVMQEMKSPCIILDSVVCQARYSDCRLFCPRSIYPYWREIWLERVEAEGSEDRAASGNAAAAGTGRG